MVGLRRLELPTSRLSGVRSNQLSYKPIPSARIVLYNNKLVKDKYKYSRLNLNHYQ